MEGNWNYYYKTSRPAFDDEWIQAKYFFGAYGFNVNSKNGNYSFRSLSVAPLSWKWISRFIKMSLV